MQGLSFVHLWSSSIKVRFYEVASRRHCHEGSAEMHEALCSFGICRTEGCRGSDPKGVDCPDATARRAAYRTDLAHKRAKPRLEVASTNHGRNLSHLLSDAVTRRDDSVHEGTWLQRDYEPGSGSCVRQLPGDLLMERIDRS